MRDAPVLPGRAGGRGDTGWTSGAACSGMSEGDGGGFSATPGGSVGGGPAGFDLSAASRNLPCLGATSWSATGARAAADCGSATGQGSPAELGHGSAAGCCSRAGHVVSAAGRAGAAARPLRTGRGSAERVFTAPPEAPVPFPRARALTRAELGAGSGAFAVTTTDADALAAAETA